MEQRIYNLIKSLVNIDSLVQDGHTPAFILEAMQTPASRMHSESQ